MSVHTKANPKVKAKTKEEIGLEPTQKERKMGSEPSRLVVNQDLGLEPTRMATGEIGAEPTPKVKAVGVNTVQPKQEAGRELACKENEMGSEPTRRTTRPHQGLKTTRGQVGMIHGHKIQTFLTLLASALAKIMQRPQIYWPKSNLHP